ncbi:hypothetical protein Salat_2666200 [Sesamum alatum]|uniref:Uncharacterized protein n=1 Tax=Sesamum alatum TaxID=300844 RepID=A0AAE1XQE6_9LAMI|nr:hypothetical protein Salat_2666200 [Sesamum alatum]
MQHLGHHMQPISIRHTNAGILKSILILQLTVLCQMTGFAVEIPPLEALETHVEPADSSVGEKNLDPEPYLKKRKGGYELHLSSHVTLLSAGIFDDILVYNKDRASHFAHLRQVLEVWPVTQPSSKLASSGQFPLPLLQVLHFTSFQQLTAPSLLSEPPSYSSRHFIYLILLYHLK